MMKEMRNETQFIRNELQLQSKKDDGQMEERATAGDQRTFKQPAIENVRATRTH